MVRGPRSVQSCCLSSYSQPAAPHRAGLLEPGLFHQPAPLEDVNVLVERFLSGAYPQRSRESCHPFPCANAQPKTKHSSCLLRTAGRHTVHVHSLPLTCSWLCVLVTRAEDYTHSVNIHSIAAILLRVLRSVEGSLLTHALYEAFRAAMSACLRGLLRLRERALQKLHLTLSLTPGRRLARLCTHTSAEIPERRSQLYVLRLLLERLPAANLRCVQCVHTDSLCLTCFLH
jgi:hypothetical protein